MRPGDAAVVAIHRAESFKKCGDSVIAKLGIVSSVELAALVHQADVGADYKVVRVQGRQPRARTKNADQNAPHAKC